MEYTPTEDAFILAHCKVDMSYGQIAESFGTRSRASVSHRFFKLKSRGVVPQVQACIGRYDEWTDEQEECLFTEFGVTPDDELRSKVGPPGGLRSLGAMYQRAYQIGASKRENREGVGNI